MTMTDRPRNDYPSKIADFLEQLATRIRSLTVDRAFLAVTWTAIGIVIATVAILAVIWLLVVIQLAEDFDFDGIQRWVDKMDR